jgi:hypothetical protein
MTEGHKILLKTEIPSCLGSCPRNTLIKRQCPEKFHIKPKIFIEKQVSRGVQKGMWYLQADSLFPLALTWNHLRSWCMPLLPAHALVTDPFEPTWLWMAIPGWMDSVLFGKPSL